MNHRVLLAFEDGNTIAVCSCGDGCEWTGKDESSKSAAQAWKKRHEEKD